MAIINLLLVYVKKTSCEWKTSLMAGLDVIVCLWPLLDSSADCNSHWIYSLAGRVGYQVSIKGSNHRYMQTVVNKKLVIARKHMLESKTKKDFSLYVCAEPRYAVVILWATQEWCWVKPFLTLEKRQLLFLLFPPWLNFFLLMNCFLLTWGHYLGSKSEG